MGEQTFILHLPMLLFVFISFNVSVYIRIRNSLSSVPARQKKKIIFMLITTNACVRNFGLMEKCIYGVHGTFSPCENYFSTFLFCVCVFILHVSDHTHTHTPLAYNTAQEFGIKVDLKEKWIFNGFQSIWQNFDDWFYTFLTKP